jgi:hypothetical protein
MKPVSDVPVIEGYSDLVQIGEGGLGRVFVATRLSTGTQAAIKQLADVSDESVVWRRVQRELAALARLKGHPNVVQVEEVLASPQGPLLVMEFAPHGSVQDLIVRSGGCMDSDQAMFVAWQVADVLSAAHAIGIVHRDIKPSNLLVSAFGQVKVCDFGISALSWSEELRERTSALSYRYASPEELDGEMEVGPATDVYSLGATLVHCLSGRPPSFGERHDADGGLLAPIRESRDPIQRELSRIVLSCLDVIPEVRPTAVELTDRLSELRTLTPRATRALVTELEQSSIDDATVVRTPWRSLAETDSPVARDAVVVTEPALTVETPTAVLGQEALGASSTGQSRGRRGWGTAAVAAAVAAAVGVGVGALAFGSDPGAAPVDEVSPVAVDDKTSDEVEKVFDTVTTIGGVTVARKWTLRQGTPLTLAGEVEFVALSERPPSGDHFEILPDQFTSDGTLTVYSIEPKAEPIPGTVVQYDLSELSPGERRTLTYEVAFASASDDLVGLMDELVLSRVENERLWNVSLRREPVILDIQPLDGPVSSGQEIQFAVDGVRRDGRPLDDVDRSEVIWASSSPDVVLIDADGSAIGGVAGSAVVSATLGGETAEMEVTVNAP